MLCGSTFQKRTAKFKFLNKLIEIVDEQRGGSSVALEVRKKLMECFLLWTVEYPDKTKIRECYNDLKRKVSFGHEMNTVKVPARSQHDDNILGKDDALVAKLLKEGGPENLQAANLLIQNRVYMRIKQDEMLRQHREKLQQIGNCLELLTEMIENYNVGDNLDTLSELYAQCLEYEVHLKPICLLNSMLDKQTLGISAHNLLNKPQTFQTPNTFN